jgi:D-alanyl-D-alanine carboxypeptidase (penicillin-binding protein 5/6)
MIVFFKHRFHLFLGLLLSCALLAPGTAVAGKRREVRAPVAQQQIPALDATKGITVFDNLPAPFSLNARAALLMDAKTGAVLYAYNEHERMQPASLAKLMTFYLSLDALQTGRIMLDTPVTVSEKAWRLSMNSSVSRMFLRVGQSVPVQDLLFGLMVSSGNDAAVALAEYLAGSTDAFAEQMNAKAKQLGLRETHFTNPDGLPAPDEYTTASDMAKLGREILDRFPEAVTYTGMKEYSFQKIKQPNFNSLLFHDARVDGLKTGHVEEVGYHLLATAHEGGTRLISAVLGTPSAAKRRDESEKLLAWGFRTFATVIPDWHKEVPRTLRVYKGNLDQVPIGLLGTPAATVLKGREAKVVWKAAFPMNDLLAPVTKGEMVGDFTAMIAGKPQTSIPIKALAAVGLGGFFKRVIDRIKLIF